jgi:hypothetical protein
MRVAIDYETGFSPANPALVFDGVHEGNCEYRDYDISSDGERFIFALQNGGAVQSRPDLVLVQNWTEELGRLLPGVE